LREAFMKKSLEFKLLGIVATLLIVGVTAAGFMAVAIQKETLYSVAGSGAENIADIIFRDIETTMLEGKADITKRLVKNISGMRGIEQVAVLNAEGREAFEPGSLALEEAALAELRSGKERLLSRDTSRLVYFMPLKNTTACRACHGADKPLLGAVKVSISIEKEYKKAMSLITMVIIATIAASLGLSFVLWVLLRKTVIRPIRAIENAAAGIAEGNLSFTMESAGDDELGRAGALLQDSFLTQQGVLRRIKELSQRILSVVHEVGGESEKVVKGAEAEAQAVSSISQSVEQLNTTAAEVADNTEKLAASAGDASASIEQMASSIASINNSIKDLNGIVESTSSSIEELTAVIKEVAGSADDLAGASEETLSSISEITAAIKEVDAGAQESARLSEQVTSDAANLGMASIAKMIAGMKDIDAAVRHTSECIGLLGSRSQEIEMILSVIENVTDDTALLSLNARILAAQAGEHGKGFAVVAGEIRDLARKTEVSTKDIAALIQAVQQEVKNAALAMEQGIGSVESGLALARDAEEALKRVLASSRKSSEMTLSIKRNTEEQAKAANLVTASTERIRNMIDYVAKATAEQSRGVVLVMEAAEKMKELSHRVTRATAEQELSGRQIARATETVSERSRQISEALADHKKGSGSILSSIEAVKDIPLENRKLAFRINKTLWNLEKDAELLEAEMERFKISEESGQSLRLGVVPLKEPSEMFRKFAPLSEYLGRRLGRRVDLKVAIDMEGAVKDLGENATQLCAMGPANYVEANRIYGARVIAKALRQGKPFHRAAIVVKTGSDIRSVRDLRARTFAFVSPKSATGHIAPLATLKDAGLTGDDLLEYRFLGSHEKVADAVLAGEFDAGGLMEETADQYRDAGLRVLQMSPEVPEFNVCCNTSVDQATMNAIRDALVALDISKAEDARVLTSLGKDCTGFMPANDSDYDIFKEKILGVENEMKLDSRFQDAARGDKR
jgi:phosphate/phosphite/phosphonate ABC transporter binding protein